MNRSLLALLGFFLFSQMTQAQPLKQRTVHAGALGGTLLEPSDRDASATVLIIPGSGPTDQDGNNPLGIRASTYRLLAEGLAAQGISSVRIDKRGMYASAAATPDPNAVTIATYAADVRSWITEIRHVTGKSCIWLLGHSEGGLVALVAGQAEPTICGIVLVAVAGRALGDVLRSQLRANPANASLLTEALAAVDSLEAGRRFDPATLRPALRTLFRAEVQAFLIDVFSYDPTRLVAGLSKPVLIIQGTEDLQVGEEDARRLAGARAGAELVLLPGVNHVLKSVSRNDRTSNLATYADPSLPLATGVITAISAFMTRYHSKE